MDDRAFLINRDCKPVMFTTRKECREWINKEYGYIRYRKDLRGYPHGWRVPQPVKLRILFKTEWNEWVIGRDSK